MKFTKVSLLAISVVAIGGISSMQATSFNNAVGLSGVGIVPSYTLTFNGAPIVPNGAITNQFAFAGVTFNSPIYYDGINNFGGCAQFNDFTGDCVTNFKGTDLTTFTAPFSIFFSTPQAYAAFALVTNNGQRNTTLTAYLDNVVVESAVVTSGYSNQNATTPNYYGFYNVGPGGFNRISIATTSNLALIDNLQLSATPEPGTVGMLALGLVGVVALARRRRSA